jgi:hypothetical protein
MTSQRSSQQQQQQHASHLGRREQRQQSTHAEVNLLDGGCCLDEVSGFVGLRCERL